jgi:YegS/Rv2252/BmrU family lipid kinase
VKDVLVIANPASAGGRTGRRWAAIAAGLREAGLDFDSVLTDRAGQATELSREAVRRSVPLVVAAGGDGTVNEVANGFFEAGEAIPTGSRLGVLPMGSGGDFRRTLGLALEPREAARVLLAGTPRRLDAGRVTYRAPGGGTGVRHFVNIADAGIGGEVVRRVNRGRKRLGPATFMVASALALAGWRNRPMTVRVDGSEHRLVAQQVVVANCQYYGGGMRIAPMALPDDGLLDVILVGDLGLVENVRGLSKVRAGRHLEAGNPKWSAHRARRVEVSSPLDVLLDLDGEQPGTVPATFEVMPGVLTVMAPL